jgi:DNA-binding CsgD family transcriptional regulator
LFDKALRKCLPQNDFIDLLCLSERSLRCRSENDFKELVFDLNELLGCTNALCTRGSIPDSFTSLGMDATVVDISYPAGFLDVYLKNKYHLIDNVLCCALTKLSPVNWLSVNQVTPATILCNDHGMRDGWAHCTVDLKSLSCTMFFLAGRSPDNSVRAGSIVDYIIPFFSLAYSRLAGTKISQATILTPKEIEVLKWLKEGKSSWEISVILGCSKRVVDFHVSNLKAKLGAVSRAQCIAKSVEMGIIDI